MLRVAGRNWLSWWYAYSSTCSPIIIEHSQRIVLAISSTHFYLTWVLKSQIFLTLSLTVLAECTTSPCHHMRLLFVIIMRIRTVFIILLLLLEGKLRLRLINAWIGCWVLCLKVFVILWIQIEMLSCVERATLITLISLRKLLLWRHIKIALRDGKLFHVALRIYILYALIHIVNWSSIFLILRSW